jgi:predicted RNA-binding Zn ribbon-like protein
MVVRNRMDEYLFDFDAGELCLDFANTNEWHASENPVEHLNSFVDLISWGEQARLISAEAAESLRQQAFEGPEKTMPAFEGAIRLREAVYRIFSRRYAGEPVPTDALKELNFVVQQALAHLQLIPEDGRMVWEWTPGNQGIDIILWSVGRSAAELLTSEKADWVRECEDDRGCGYLFIDQSKNHSRRWCSMESCGNRAKARRHYTKVKTGS